MKRYALVLTLYSGVSRYTRKINGIRYLASFSEFLDRAVSSSFNISSFIILFYEMTTFISKQE